MMLTKNQHPRMNYISRLLALPLLVIVFGAFTIKIANKLDNGFTSSKIKNKIVVVLDAGHGGQDAGVINKNGITEKDLALQLVKKIKALNKDEDIEIILTRDKDVFDDPRQKAEFAKINNPDLFISVHLDNSPKIEWNTHTGMSVFIAKNGISNIEKSKVLAASIINSFKNNYGISVPATVSQRQVGIWILQANSFPSVLIEAGFLTNDRDAAYLLSEKGQEAFAKNVLNSIKQYAAANLNAVNFSNNIQDQSDSSIYYKGKKVKTYSVSVNAKENKITGVKLLFFEKTTTTISGKEAYSIGVEIPPVKDNGELKTKQFLTQASGSTKSLVANLPAVDNKMNNNSAKSEQAISKNENINSADKVFTQVEVEPEFPGGKDAWRKFLQINLNGSIAVKEGLKAGSYTFITKFIVHEDGSVSDFTSEKNINDSIAKHCIDVIKKGPKWKPAIQNGYIVSAYRKQPITFVVSEE